MVVSTVIFTTGRQDVVRRLLELTDRPPRLWLDAPIIDGGGWSDLPPDAGDVLSRVDGAEPRLEARALLAVGPVEIMVVPGGARMEADGVAYEAVRHLPHERIAWSWFSVTDPSGHGPESGLVRELVRAAGEDVVIDRLGLRGHPVANVGLEIERPGQGIADDLKDGQWYSRPRRQVLYSGVWPVSGSAKLSDARAWWERAADRIAKGSAAWEKKHGTPDTASPKAEPTTSTPPADTSSAGDEDDGADERVVRFSPSEAERLGLDVDELVDDVIMEAVDGYGAGPDDPSVSGDFLDVYLMDGDSLDRAAAAAVRALQARGLISAHVLAD